MTICFNKYEEINKDEARKLIVECAQDFLAEINSNSVLQPYLKVHPFTSRNIDLTIYCFNSDGTNTIHPNIEVVSVKEGIVHYDTSDPEDEFAYKLMDKEEFDEAVVILRKEAEEKK